MKRYTKGFTLIELLVVIAIIGILSSVVLVSLSSARNKGRDASMQGSMTSLRSSAEMYYSSNGSSGYNNLFTGNNTWASVDTGTQNLLTAVSNLTTVHTAVSSASIWAAQAQLPSTVGSYFCVDSTGAAKTGTTALNPATMTACP
jgi:prepilin-type N-terminal cleavage/methylation domain-containing protein